MSPATTLPTLGQDDQRVLPYGDSSRQPVRPQPSEHAARRLDDLLRGSKFLGYTYAYPHKTSYRPLLPPRALADLWRNEDRGALFLYLHVPFCEMRCGFCNLFTQNRPGESLPTRFVSTLERQVERIRRALGAGDDEGGPARLVRAAFGGGTPTQLAPDLFARVLDLPSRLGVSLSATPTSLETSPETATAEKLKMAVERGVDRISIGIQSFHPAELKALGRPQSTAQAEAALDRIRATGVAVLNLDLIYGMGGQTTESWLQSLQAALRWQPEELYLYPLYLRPRTGLGRLDRSWSDQRLDCYRAGRDLLLSEGYEQFSMRLFRRPRPQQAPSPPPYRCQEDGMVGLGCGARSYTRSLHYSDEWAVSRQGVKQILASWVARDDESFDYAHHGVHLDGEEQRRRYLLQSVLNLDGLDLTAYEQRFGSRVQDDFPPLVQLFELDLATCDDRLLRLTERGIEASDLIGPWLYSERVRRLSGEYDVR